MPDMEEDGLLGLAVQANMARMHKMGQREFVEELAGTLERWLPDETEVQRRGSLFGEKKIVAVRVHLGEHIYSVDLPGRGPAAAAVTRVVRGIKLKTEPLSIDEWLAVITEALAQFAERNQQARDALGDFLEKGQDAL